MRAMRTMRGAHQGDRGDRTEGGEEGGGKRGEGKLLQDGTGPAVIEGFTRGPGGPRKPFFLQRCLNSVSSV